MDNEVVWLTEHRRFAFLVIRNAFTSLVYWVEDGETTEIVVENDEYVFWEERAIDFESD